MNDQMRQIWEQYRIYVIAAIVGVLAAGSGYSYALGRGAAPVTGSPASPAAGEITVDIEGAVVVPGVRKVVEGSLLDEVIAIAGGLTEQADVEGIAKELNRSDKVKDHQKIYIPFQGEGRSTGSASGQHEGLVNINDASPEELDKLPGVGPSTAQKIIDYREQNGPFQAPEDLMNIPGISDKKFAEMKDKVTV